MNDWDLRMFETVARTGGIGRAAVELNTVQSNVTNRIHNLEGELDAVLFERHSRGVTLTAAGQRLRPYAVQILNLLDQAQRAAVDNGVPNGPLSLGSLETTAALRMPSVLAAFVQNFPGVDLRLSTGTTSSLIESVLNHELDGAFVSGPVVHPKLVAEAIFSEELVLVTSTSVPGIDQLCVTNEVRILVFRRGCSYRQQLETLLSRRGIVGLRTLEFGSLDAILGCVSAGVGLSLLPLALVKPLADSKSIRIHHLPRFESEVETVFVRRTDSHCSSGLTEFLRLSKTMAVNEASALAG